MKRPLMVLTHRVFPETKKALNAHGRVWSPDGETAIDRGRLVDLAREADALMVFMPDKIDQRLLERCPRLRIVACALKGYDNIDVEACSRRGIWVSIVPDLLSAPTADLAVGLLLALTRKILEGDRFVRSGRFRGWRPELYGIGLEGKTAGILGCGAVGKRIATRLHGFGMKILCCDTSPVNPQWLAGIGACQVDFEELLRRADVLVLAAPLTPASFHLVGKEALECMKPGACLVNVGRGSVVDETAVTEALQNGRLGGYAADVFELEDLSRRDPPEAIPSALLLDTARTVFTPHLGSAVAEVRLAIELAAAANIIDVLQDRRPRDAINRPQPRR